jgi:hypothetical protein
MNRDHLFKLSLLVLAVFLHQSCIPVSREDIHNDDGQRVIGGIYRAAEGRRQEKNIWIVDGLIIRREIFGEFLYGGNHERYPWVPADEIWIDNAISADEFRYTLAHELNERNLMARRRMSYSEAHDSSLALERLMRNADLKAAVLHEKTLHPVSPTDCYNDKQIAGLPDSVLIHNIYRQLLRKEGNISIWIVDGAGVRRDIFPDFGFSGNDFAYRFIPENEIWIDAQVSCEEIEFSITSELYERMLLTRGIDYDEAYIKALERVKRERDSMLKKANGQSPVHPPSVLYRDIGSGEEKIK